jgi:hypothetical protein
MDLFPACVDSTGHFNAVYESKSQLLIEHSNATILRYGYIEQLPNKGRKGRRKVQNMFKLITNIRNSPKFI